jgi:Rieske Fe-S protein
MSTIDRRTLLHTMTAAATLGGLAEQAMAQTQTPPAVAPAEVLKLDTLAKFISEIWGTWVFSFDGRDALLVRVPEASTRTLELKFKSATGQDITAHVLAHQLVCTHLGCSSPAVDIDDEEAAKKLKERRIFCTCHGSEFRQTDGSVLKGPATAPLRGIRLAVAGESLQAVGYFS